MICALAVHSVDPDPRVNPRITAVIRIVMIKMIYEAVAAIPIWKGMYALSYRYMLRVRAF